MSCPPRRVWCGTTEQIDEAPCGALDVHNRLRVPLHDRVSTILDSSRRTESPPRNHPQGLFIGGAVMVLICC